ncbi:MAG: hypothetical protein ABI836_10130 [Gemmatimonadota bacterium]
MRLSQCMFLLLCALLLACNDPARPVVPVDSATTRIVYELELAQLKSLLAKDTLPGGLFWRNQMYMNNRILLPPADSAQTLMHDAFWLQSLVDRGIVRGVCGPPPYSECPRDQPIAYTSLGVPWTRGGDTVFVGGGYTGLVPGQTAADAIFWLFTVVKSDTGWVVKAKSAPNTMTFTDSTSP